MLIIGKNIRVMKVILIFLGLTIFLFMCCRSRERMSFSHIDRTQDSGLVMAYDIKPLPLNLKPTRDDVDRFINCRDSESFERLCDRFLNTDGVFDVLLYTLVAIDKFQLYEGYYEIAFCLTNGFSNLSVSEHSKELALYYLKKGIAHKDKHAEAAYSHLCHLKQNDVLFNT